MPACPRRLAMTLQPISWHPLWSPALTELLGTEISCRYGQSGDDLPRHPTRQPPTTTDWLHNEVCEPRPLLHAGPFFGVPSCPCILPSVRQPPPVSLSFFPLTSYPCFPTLECSCLDVEGSSPRWLLELSEPPSILCPRRRRTINALSPPRGGLALSSASLKTSQPFLLPVQIGLDPLPAIPPPGPRRFHFGPPLYPSLLRTWSWLGSDGPLVLPPSLSLTLPKAFLPKKPCPVSALAPSQSAPF